MSDKKPPKIFVLDTNVFLHNHEALKSFADNEVVIPFTVIEELDTFKKDTDEKGRNARTVIRTLDRLRSHGSLREGVVNSETGGKVRVSFEYGDLGDLGLPDSPDNRIISTAYVLHKKGDRKVIFVSKDINVRIKADAMGLHVVDFEKQKINFDELYSGWKEIKVPHAEIDRFYQKNIYTPSGNTLYPHQGIKLVSGDDPKHTALGRYEARSKQVVRLRAEDRTVFGIQARNMEQEFALEFLLDDRVQLVTLIGQAGTGKTLLALAAALNKTLRGKKYERILVSRPIIPMGRDIGYLPGSKEEKLEHWMQPIFDNLEFLLEVRRSRETPEKRMKELLEGGIISLEALTYIRGRSVSGQYVIIDEAQNLTPHEVKTIISRAGEGSKMVLTGDPYQIDNPYLDSSSNGLTYVAERMKGQELFAHITLTKSERSTLASIAAELL
ncbi:MAG: PhoH family protein [Planctomycetota bacterium]|nr:MAG: PhoH family protein [Planctomycetota bacterium]